MCTSLRVVGITVPVHGWNEESYFVDTNKTKPLASEQSSSVNTDRKKEVVDLVRGLDLFCFRLFPTHVPWPWFDMPVGLGSFGLYSVDLH